MPEFIKCSKMASHCLEFLYMNLMNSLPAWKIIKQKCKLSSFFLSFYNYKWCYLENFTFWGASRRRYLTQHFICSLYSGLKKGWVFSKMFPQLLYKYASNKISNFLFITNIGYYCTIQTLYSYKFGEFSDPELLPELLRPSLGELAINLLETPFFSLK